MIIPDWMKQQENALLLIALLLTLWLWLLVSRRQEESVRDLRKSPLTADELGRAVFVCCLSKDLKGYRSLFLNAREAHDKLGAVAEAFLEQRNLSLLQQAFTQMQSHISVGSVYLGVDDQGKTTMVIRVRSSDGEESSVPVGSITVVGSVLRLLEPHIQSNAMD